MDLEKPRIELSLADAVLTIRELSRLQRKSLHSELAQMIAHEAFVGDIEREVPAHGEWVITDEYAEWRDSVEARALEIQTFLRKLVGSALALFPVGDGTPEE